MGTATLVERGPDSIEIKSPVKVQILEKGRSGVKASIEGTDKVLRFTTARETVWDPAGWAPNAGEKAQITFHLQASTIGFNLAYIAEKIEQEK